MNEHWTDRYLEVLRDGSLSPAQRLQAMLLIYDAPARVHRRLACDYAERVLPMWEEWARHHAPEYRDAPRRCIETVRAYLRGEATWEEVQQARQVAQAATSQTAPVPAAAAAYAAGATAIHASTIVASSHAAAAAVSAVIAFSDVAYVAEHRWQVAHAIKVFKEEREK